MRKATVRIQEIITRIAEVEIPTNTDDADVESYIQDYIHGCLDNSYDWDCKDVTKEDTVIIDYDLYKE